MMSPSSQHDTPNVNGEEFIKRFSQPRRGRFVSTIISIALGVLCFVMGIGFLVSPMMVRDLLYPCLSDMEKDEEYITMVEQDMIRLAGGCILSIAVCSALLLMTLLPCYINGTKGSEGYLGATFALRLVLFIHATLGLAFVGVGMFNLENAEGNHSYDGHKHHHSRCSSLPDQTILWVGVAVVCSASIGLMVTFCPESSTNDYGNETSCCCCINHSRIGPAPQHNGEVTEPLLSNEDSGLFDSVTEAGLESQQNGDHTLDNSDASSDTVNAAGVTTQPEEATSSRLRGTTRLLKLAGSESMYLWLGIVVLLIRLPFSLSIPNFVSAAIGDLINADYDGAKRNVLLIFLLGSVDSVLDFWCIFLFGYAKENIVKSVRLDTFRSILRQEKAFFDKTNSGDLISRLTADCGEMAGDLTWFFRFSVEACVRIVGISVYMIYRSPFLGLVTVGIVPIVGVINKLYGDWLSKNAISVQNSLADATSTAHESIACINTVITSASEEYEGAKYAHNINALYALNIRQLIAQGVYFMVVSTFLINTCVQAALLLVGSMFVEEGTLTPEILLAFMLYQGQLQEYTLNLFQSYSSLIKSSGAGDRVFYLLDREPSEPATGNKEVQLVGKMEVSATDHTTHDDITLSNVSFSYPTRPESLALNSCSIQIQSGSLVALVGHSGCGKSTIVSLLERMYDPCQGRIMFGSTNLKDMNLKAHRKKIGLVTQDPVLFSGSIKDNIAYGVEPSPSMADIISAAQIANAHSFIQTFPEKYETQVGERGTSLSGGQKQRIAIARALVRKPDLLLLDEATSALDPDSEAAVQQALNELLRNRSGMTTVVIAHRLSTVRFAESIAVMKNGTVVEQGSHEDLITNENGHYRRMVDRSDSMGVLPG